MRILLAQNSLYYPAHGGGDKSNRLLLEALARQGHDCRVVARVHAGFGEQEHRRYLAELARREITGISTDNGVARFTLRGVDVHAVTSHPNFRGYFGEQIRDFRPGVIILSTDDPAQLLLSSAVGPNPARVVYLTRTTLALPFGPEGAFPSEAKTERLRSADGVVGVSEYVARYIRKWSGIGAVALPISLLAAGPWPELGRFDNPFVTLVNPCAVKGLSIFLELADRLPDLRFAAVPTWGTTAADREALDKRPNIEVLDPVDNIDHLLEQTKVMLVPSLWAEARSRIVVEAMLRGVPVLAANVGGIPEAMMGVHYLLPVRQIEKYRRDIDEMMVPVADVPPQEVDPWMDALRTVTEDRSRFEQLSRESRAAALLYANQLSIHPFEEYLEEIAEQPRNPLRDRDRTTSATAHTATPGDSLTPEKRALLALRLKKRSPSATHAAGSLWFPNIEHSTDARLRLFCFPYAGGGASVFRNWPAGMPEGVAAIPTRLPGRENRTSEQPIDRIEALVDSMLEAIRPYLERPFAFFGHSMGAMLGFELARQLRRLELPAPAALLVAGARAPQFRKGHVPSPTPTDDEFLREIRKLEGAPPEVLENDELLRYLLPALKADSELGRTYVYDDGPPLDIPIRAYVGRDDARLPRDVIEAWKVQSTGAFAMRDFDGGHFFLHTAEAEFLAALSADLALIQRSE